jgi:hypothetical protein
MKGEGLNEKYATQCLVRMELHVFPAIGAYNRAEYLLERKKMMQEYADYLDAMATIKLDKVVAMAHKS